MNAQRRHIIESSACHLPRPVLNPIAPTEFTKLFSISSPDVVKVGPRSLRLSKI